MNVPKSPWVPRWLLLLEIQLVLTIVTLPVGRIGGDALGLGFSLGGNTYKLFTPFLLTWLAWWVSAGRPALHWGRFTSPLAAFLLTGLLANAGTPYLYETGKWLAKYALCLLFYLSLINTPWRNRTVRACTTGFLLGNAYLALVVFSEILIGGGYRAEGTLGHPNLLGAYVVLALPLVLLIAFRTQPGWVSRAAYGVGMALFLAGGLTFSRAAYLGLLAGFVILWLAGRRHTLPQLVPLAMVAVTLWFATGDLIGGRWSELRLDLQGTRPESRLRIWNESYSVVMPGMAVSGVGTTDQFQERWWGQRLKPGPLPPAPRFNHAHNVPLHVMLTMGLAGLIVLAWMTLTIVRAVPPWSPEGVWGERGDAAYLLAGAVGFGLFGLVDMVLFTKNVTATAILYLGLIDLMVPRDGKSESAWSAVTRSERPEGKPKSAETAAIPMPDPLAGIDSQGPPLRILHLYSNYRFTGPAEIVVALAKRLAKRGHRVSFACPKRAPKVRISSRGLTWRQGEDATASDMLREVERAGIETEPRLALNRHFNIRDNAEDVALLRQILSGDAYDVLHLHQGHDRNLAVLANRLCQGQTAVVASHYRSGAPRAGILKSLLVGGVDLLLMLSEADRRETIRSLGLAEETVAAMPGFVDTGRFTPERDGSALRAAVDASERDIIFGVIARFQPYRRHDLVIRAWPKVLERHPEAKLALIGRGEYQAEMTRLVDDLGLSNGVHFAGYFQGDDFPNAVAGLDGLIYLRPGSDGSCRAVLQAMATGVVPVLAPVGVLPDLVSDGESGLLLASDDSEVIAEAVCRLCADRDRLEKRKRAARERTLNEYATGRVVERLERAYRYAIQRKSRP